MNWTEVLLEHICEMQTGKTPPTDRIEYFNGNVNWFNPSDIGINKVLVDSKRKISEIALTEKKATSFQANSVLITCIGEIGRCGIIRERASSNQQITALTFDDRVDVNYAYYWFIRNRSRLKNVSNDALVPILNNATLKRLSFQFPPLPTQQKIAAILDEADALRRKDKALLAKYDELLQAVFYDMFGDPVKNEKGWEVSIVIEHSECIVPGRDKPKSFSGDVPWITTDDLVHLGETKFSKKRMGLNKEEIKEVRAKTIPINSVIMTCVGDLGIVSIAGIEMVINQQLHAFQPHKELNSTFLMFNLSAQKEYMLRIASSTTVPYMNKTICNSVPIILPPIALQNEFAAVVHNIQHQKSQIIQQQTHSENLFQSLLQRAFKGELVG